MAVDLNERQVTLGIGADNLCIEGDAGIREHLNLYGVIDDVIVGDDVSIGADEEPGTLPLHELARLTPVLTRHHSLAVWATKIFEKLLEWGAFQRIAAVAVGNLLRSSISFHTDGHNGWLDRGYEVGESGHDDWRGGRPSRRALAKGSPA
jgi:hypothetical protein